MELILCAIIGVAAGTLGGLFGLSGGVLVVPALVFIFHMKQHTAQGTSMLAMLAPVGLFGVINYYRHNHIEPAKSLLIAGGIVIGSFLGSKLSLSLCPNLMRRVFSIFLMLVAVALFFKK